MPTVNNRGRLFYGLVLRLEPRRATGRRDCGDLIVGSGFRLLSH
jgi:hypothetical protein